MRSFRCLTNFQVAMLDNKQVVKFAACAFHNFETALVAKGCPAYFQRAAKAVA
jgi:hypothetical protein